MPERRVTLYIVHFWEPFGGPKHKAQHYVGATKDMTRRLSEYRRGKGSAIMRHAYKAGIRWTWRELDYDSSFEQERRIKRGGHYDRVCPVCRGDLDF